ncbi:hypothetical protein NPIL_611351, partial [Nephila pilipes]
RGRAAESFQEWQEKKPQGSQPLRSAGDSHRWARSGLCPGVPGDISTQWSASRSCPSALTLCADLMALH